VEVVIIKVIEVKPNNSAHGTSLLLSELLLKHAVAPDSLR
jgi:hypothetical protein